MMTSPGFIPARSAGLPGITCGTSIPEPTSGKCGSRFRSCAEIDAVTAESSTCRVSVPVARGLGRARKQMQGFSARVSGLRQG